MGCCPREKKPEENEILLFFNRMEKENKFEFSIEKYEESYDMIINLSSNTFKKLKKKQQVRIGFVKEIIKNILKKDSDEKEDRITRRIVFYILLLTLTLDNYLNERKETNMNNNNDLQQFLLVIVIKILNKNFINFQNLKVVLFYLANMLVKLFSEIKDINHYFNIEDYINLINTITEQKDVLKNYEVYPYIKVNLYCLGRCFLANYPEIKLKPESIDILCEYYVSAYFFNLSFLLDNFAIFNKYLFLYNINNNPSNNKTINNNYNNKIASDLVNKNNNNFLSISNVKNIINTNDVSNYSISQSRIINNICKNSFISGADDLSYNNNEFLDIIKTKEYQEIQKISFSLYSFLKTTIQDTLSGKQIFKKFGDIIDEKFKTYMMGNPSMKKRNSSTSVIPDANFNNNIFKIISLFLFNKCKTENDKIIILSFLDYISDKIKEDKLKEQYYDILLQLFFLFNNEQMKQIIITLLSHIFIKEIENHNTCDFIEELFGISQANNIYLFGLNKMKIIKHFLINISTKFKEIQNNNLKVKILVKLSDVLNKYIKYYNKNFTESPSPELSISENIKYKLKKEEIMHLYQYMDLDDDNFIEDKKINYFIFINYIKFFITFSHFLEYNFQCDEIFKELAIRKKTFIKLVNFITYLEILSIEGEKSYVNDIIKLVKITLKIIEKNSIECFEDFQILCSIFADSLQRISKVTNSNKNIDFHFLKLAYTVLIFFLIRLKTIFRLPSSIIKIHKDIIKCIKNYNNDISIFLDEIDFELFSNAKLTKKIYQDLKNYLKNENKLEIDLKIFSQIMDIIYSKLFGKTSSLFIFLESQNCKIINEDFKKSDTVEITEGPINSLKTSIIQTNYVNEITIKLADEKDSNFSLKKYDDSSQKLYLPKVSEDNKDSLFNKKEISSSEQEFSDKLKI